MKNKINNKSIKSDMLKQPSIFDLVACSLRKSFGLEKKRRVFNCPESIGPYKLISKIKKSNNYINYGIGIYENDKGKKVFIKTWQGKTKSFPYYSLINEYNMAKILSNAIKNIGKIKFGVPNPIGYHKTQNSLSVIFEYVSGKPLSKSPFEEQSRVINEAILFLDSVSPVLDKVDEKYIKKRGRLFCLFSLPAIFLYSFLLEKESKKTIFYSFIKTYRYSFSLINKRLTLVHGDLHPDNVFVSKSKFYILDSEHMKYTFSEYDLNHLSIAKRGTKLLSYILKMNRDFTQNKFLSFYIAIQSSIFIDSKTKQRNYFDYLKNNL